MTQDVAVFVGERAGGTRLAVQVGWLRRVCGLLAVVGVVVGVGGLRSGTHRVDGMARADGAGGGSLSVVQSGALLRGVGFEQRSFWARRSEGRVVFAGRGGLGASYAAGRLVVSAAGGRVRFSGVSVGRGRLSVPVRFAAPRVSRNRVVLSGMSGRVGEWLANGPGGLEQGFTLTRRVSGRGLLVISQRLSGRLRARLMGGDVRFGFGAGAVTYHGLVVTDARGRALPGWLALAQGRLLIRVDDRHAVYPLRVDPVFTSLVELTASDGAGGEFGISVAVSGSTLAVGGVGGAAGDGAVYVFSKPAGGWSASVQPVAVLSAADGGVGDRFGAAVAIDGSTIVVGAPAHPVNNNGSQGALYIYSEPPGGWVSTSQPTAEWSDPTGAGGEELGTAVAVNGSVIVAGSPSVNRSQGVVFVLSEPDGGWGNLNESSPVVTLTAPDGNGGDLGQSVAVDNNTIVAGAYGVNSLSGAVYVFTEPDGGWVSTSQPAAVLTATGNTGGQMGFSVAISGPTIVAGAYLETVNSNSGQGAAYVFSEPDGGWQTTSQPTATLTAPDGAAGDEFGFSVAVTGSTIGIGAPIHAIGTNTGQGEAYAYTEPAGGWASTSQATVIAASDGVAHAGLGRRIALQGSTVFLGAAGQAENNVSQQGAVYVGDLAPLNTNPPTVTGATTPGQTLTETNGTWTNTPTSYTYQWQDCNATVTSCTPIPGATNQSYVLTGNDVGDTIEVQESATNAFGTGTPAVSTPTATITQPPAAATTTTGTTTTAAVASTSQTTTTSSLTAPELLSFTITKTRLSSKTHGHAQTITFNYTLNEPATSTLKLQHLTAGRELNGKCQTPTARNSHHKACARTTTIRTITTNAHPGNNQLNLPKPLPAGHYQATLRASANNQTTNRTLHFTTQ